MSSYRLHEFNAAYLNGTLPAFDGMAAFRALEHIGLGRYGDGLHPWGDLVTMARTHCVLKPGGMVMVGIPTGYQDTLLFNAHR